MAFAPGVSIEYWQELSERRAVLELGDNAAESLIIANKLDEASAMFEQSEDFEDAKLTRSL